MYRNTISILAAGCLIAIATLSASFAAAQGDKVKAAMTDLKAETTKLGAPKEQGTDLYFGDTKADNTIVDAVVKKDGGVASLFAKEGDKYVRVATTLKTEDGSSAVGTALDAKSPAAAKLKNGEAYEGDAKVFGKTYAADYEPIKDPSGAVIGAYFVGQDK